VSSRRPVAAGLRIAATLAIVIAGLVLLRWVAAVTASPPAPPTARSTYAGSDLPSIRALALRPTSEPTPEIDLAAAYDEAMRLAHEALLDDDLEAARDLYFLAAEAVPGDPEAAARVRQVEAVIGIDDRTTSWREALDDVEDLLALAPRSQKIARAYTEALVGAGREALAQGNALRAVRLCGEANQRAPTRNDARVCTIQAVATSTATARATAPTTPTPTPTATPRVLPSATPQVATDRVP
jgi:hypothetical protein